MAITQRTPTGAGVAGSASFTVTLPTGTTTGDLLLVAVGNLGSTGPATPTGWTLLSGAPFTIAGSGLTTGLSIFSAPYSAGLTLSFTNAGSTGVWACNAYIPDPTGTDVAVDNQAAATLATSSTTLPTGAPVTGAAAGDYEALVYVWPSGTTITTVAAGSTIDRTQANSTFISVAFGHNNTTSLGATVTPTAFSQTLSVAAARKIGVGIDLKTTGSAGGVTETNLSRIGLEATGLTVKAALGSALRGNVGFGATCTALKITTGTSRAEPGLRASAIGAKVVTATAQAEAGLESKATAVKAVTGTSRAQAGLEATGTAVKSITGTARAQAGLDATETAIKAGVGTARASAGVEATSTESKIGSGTGRASVGIESTANAAKSVSGTANAEAGLESTATASRTAATTATAQGKLGLDATSTTAKAGLGTGQASVGAESTGQAAKIAGGTGQASVGPEAATQGSKHGAAQAVASVGVQGQCASAIKSGIGTARGSVGLRARSVTTLPTPAGAAPKLIWVDGRLALRVSQVVYERL